MPKPWFQMKAAEDSKPPVIDILGQIGTSFWDDSATSAKEFNDGLKALGNPTDVEVNINSPGGSYFQGVAIANIMKTHPATFTTRIIGEASSAASVIFAAGDRRIAMKGTLSLIHDPANLLCGPYTSDEMIKMAEDLEKTKQAAVDIYADVFNISRDEIAEMMKNQTLLMADEALEYGYATETEDGPEVTASADGAKASMQLMVMQATLAANEKEVVALKNKLADRTNELTDLRQQLNPVAADADAVMAACEEVQMSAQIPAMLKAKLPIEQVKVRLTEMRQVADICAATNIPVDTVLANFGNPADMIRISVTEALAAAEQDTDNHPPGAPGSQPVAGRQPDRQSIYQSRNKE